MVTRRHDEPELNRKLSSLEDPIIADYIWYRTCQIKGSFMPIPTTRFLFEEELKKVCQLQDFSMFMIGNIPRRQMEPGIIKLVSILTDEFYATCLSENEFEWLDVKHTRLLCFLWRLMGHINITTDQNNHTQSHIQNFKYNSVLTNKNIINDVNYNNRPNHKARKSDIICIINRIQFSKQIKMNFVNSLINFSADVMKKREIQSWLAKDQENKIPWLNNYLTHNQIGYIPLVINETSGHENDLISFFDVLSIFNIDKYKLLVANLKKAWSQKIFREKNKNNKQYSINMSSDIGSILDQISIRRNENKNAIVEALIRAEYEKTQI